MTQKIYQVDAFAEKVFTGNPAAVCPLDQWMSDDLLQKIAMENNLAETAYYVRDGDQYQIRWFTPTVEVDLCGHATLASAYVLFNHENFTGNTIRFYSHRSGELTVTRNGDLLTLNFPTDKLEAVELTAELAECFNTEPALAFKGKTDYMLVFEREDEIKNLIPHLDKISKLPARGVIVTAKGEEVDFVSRFFGPQSGIDEDPVTGSAHTTLVPYWAGQLGRQDLSAIQLSARKGYLHCKYLNNRVEISGKGKLFLKGEIYID
ncbi:PhzF family phenazine biosynthesis protein [Flavihumibacter sp. ZG627]|uniref:PhzF family phenazine biosynthesis protein n=1 Tax=Flavihumibacter sp. ZG627 TaxID=1463156 RepID=UPI0005809255|nr:PhzF family phenazine biosynthesis protein [Flavihumibacter sp. ZG627]KIC91651.1 isomerase [Flavihumibacter sp. ZG627]